MSVVVPAPPSTGRMPDTEVHGKSVYLSRHAIEAARDRGFTLDQVISVLRQWETRYIQGSRYRTGSSPGDPYMYQAGDIGVGVQETRSTIIVKTVLLREVRQWNNEDARARASKS